MAERIAIKYAKKPLLSCRGFVIYSKRCYLL